MLWIDLQANLNTNFKEKIKYANYIHAELHRSDNVIYEYKCGLLLPELMPTS
jgi:hypothetical protein